MKSLIKNPLFWLAVVVGAIIVYLIVKECRASGIAAPAAAGTLPAAGPAIAAVPEIPAGVTN